MKMRKITKIASALLLGIAVMTINSCEEDIILFDVDCSECYTQRPEYATMTIELTINEENPQVPVIIYLGEYEKQFIRVVDTAYSSVIKIDLAPARFYTVQAKYKVGSKTIYALDGDEIELLKVTSQCDSTCWVIRGGEVNVRLKYDDPGILPK